MLHSGIDPHERMAVIATVDADGQRVREVQRSTTRTAPSAWATAR
jgi:hypothetical protein